MKACARDAETALRPSVPAEAVRTELRHLRPSVVMLVRRALAARQQFLFPAGSFERVPAPATPIESDFLREVVPIAKCPSSIHDALALGAGQAVRGRVRAMRREIRAQCTVGLPSDLVELLSRFDQASERWTIRGSFAGTSTESPWPDSDRSSTWRPT